MADIGQQNLINALSRARAVAAANVGVGATELAVPIAGLNLSTSNLAGGWALFAAGALGPASPATLAPIASNGAGALAFAAGALATAPLPGSQVWLFQSGTFNVTVGAPENISQWGGATVAGAGPDGYPKVQQGYSEAAPGNAAPPHAVQIAGTDGADLRVVATDAEGALKTSKSSGTATITVANIKNSAAAANTPLITDFTVPSNGTLNFQVAIKAGASASTFSYTLDGANYITVNGGQTLTVGAGFGSSLPVAAGDVINFEVSTSTTLAALEAFFADGQG